jgi:serine/threonine protein kinase
MDVPLIGHRWAHLEIRELLGIGGAAEVYRAWTPLGSGSGVKVLSQRAEPDLVLRFVREGRELAGIRHPHIVTVYGIGESDQGRYIEMELWVGKPQERLQREPLTWTEAIEITLQIAQALSFAHNRGIIHRDVKPATSCSASTASQIDRFRSGSPQRRSSLTQMARSSHVFYLPPEQAAGREVDGRSDLYALGAVLFEMRWAAALHRHVGARHSGKAPLRDPRSVRQSMPICHAR